MTWQDMYTRLSEAASAAAWRAGSSMMGGGGGGGGDGGGRWDIRRFHAVIWSASAALASIPWMAGVLGPAGAWCWIDARDGRRAQVFRLMCFYLPLWSIIAFEVVVYWRIVKKLMAVTRLAAATKAMRADMRREDRERTKMRAAIAASAAAEASSAASPESLPISGVNGAAAAPAAAAAAGPPAAAELDAEEEDDYADAVADSSEAGRSDTLKRLLRRLGAYPAILIVAWFWATVRHPST